MPLPRASQRAGGAASQSRAHARSHHCVERARQPTIALRPASDHQHPRSHTTTAPRINTKRTQDALAALLSGGAEALVLDLRDNPGGAIGGGVDVPSLLLPPGTPVVVLEDAKGRSETVSQAGALLLKRVRSVRICHC
jgi:Peptidase family S41